MHRHCCQLALLALCVFIETSGPARAGEDCCADCGCIAECRKVCRLVCEDREIEAVCWGCQCEDFCVPGPSTPCCQDCEKICGACPGCKGEGVYAEPRELLWTRWLPGCTARISTKKKLMRRIETRKVPGYKWVVEDLCADCEAGGCTMDAPPRADHPILPVPASEDAVLAAPRQAGQ